MDSWVMQKSKEFLDWMKKHHPNIFVIFVLMIYTMSCSQLM